jgi:nitrite reductase/ring-hydroxylating ferredoxin subunit
MDRSEFLKVCGKSCLAFTGISAVLTSCVSSRNVQATVSENKITLMKKEFLRKENSASYRPSLIVRAQGLSHPIVIYRKSESEFRALSLECPHQHMELNVSGDLISCSAHGSEFNNEGKVTQGPADRDLTSYRITETEQTITIYLR